MASLQILLQKPDRLPPSLRSRFAVGVVVLLPEKAVAGAVEDVRRIRLLQVLHRLTRRLNGRGDAVVVCAIQAQHRAGDLRQRIVLRWRAVADDGGGEPGLRGRVLKTRAAAPAEA